MRELSALCQENAGEAKRAIKRLARVEARVAQRLEAVRELLLEHRAGGPTEAFGHVVSSVLEVDAAEPLAFALVESPCRGR